MHLRYSYVKLDKNSLSLSANSKASFLGESFLGKKKKKKSLIIWITTQLASGTLSPPSWKYLPILGKRALLQLSCSLQQKKGKMELDYKHRLMTREQKLKT